MKHLKDLITELKTKSLRISTTKTKNGEVLEKIQQTDSNNLKKLVMDAIAQDIKEEVTDYIYKVEKGYVLEIENDSIADGITNEDGSGAISVELQAIIKGLDYNAMDESADYADRQEEKAEKAKIKAEEKARKIQSDTAARAKAKEKKVE